jgi:sugar O-acyltransferase (sialic acid O-acetyltransferase NeuD family)
MSSSILVVGAGGHARSCIDVVESTGALRIAGLIGKVDEVGSMVFGYTVLGTEADLKRLRPSHREALVAVGHIRTAVPRETLFSLLRDLDFALPVIVSPRGYVSPRATIGEGTIVMHGAVVNAGARIGRNCIVNSQALIEHDVEVGDHCHISTGARVNGGVTVGHGTFIGSGSTILQGIRIGDRCTVAMGASARRDCPDGTTVVPDRRKKS